MKTDEIVAIKISKQKEQDIRSSMNEANHLQRVGINIKTWAQEGKVVEIRDSFSFRGHFAIVFEILDINLYRWIKNTSFEQRKG